MLVATTKLEVKESERFWRIGGSKGRGIAEVLLLVWTWSLSLPANCHSKSNPHNAGSICAPVVTQSHGFLHFLCQWCIILITMVTFHLLLDFIQLYRWIAVLGCSLLCTFCYVTALKNAFLKGFSPVFPKSQNHRISSHNRFQPPSGQIMNCSLVLPLVSLFHLKAENFH